MRKIFSWAIAIGVLFGLLRLSAFVFGPTLCRDGWHSASIGRQGACSHHGGVDRSKNILPLIFTGLAAWAGIGFHSSPASYWLTFQRPPGPLRPEPPPPLSSPPPTPLPSRGQPSPPAPIQIPAAGEAACPKCGGGMVMRRARRGRHKHKPFWGCLRFPFCNGTQKFRPRLVAGRTL